MTLSDNTNFSHSETLIASLFAGLAYNHRRPDFDELVALSGWQGIALAHDQLASHGFSPSAGGYGVRDGLAMQSFAFAGKRTASDGTHQFVVAFEGSNPPFEEPADWLINAGRYGWSQYYASLMPLMQEVIRQLLDAQAQNLPTQLILTGHSLGGAAAMVALADLLTPQGDLWPLSNAALAAGNRVLDSVNEWSDNLRQTIADVTTLVTFGAPSFLIEPQKLGSIETAAFLSLLPITGLAASSFALLGRAIGALTVDTRTLPDFPAAEYASRAFQFEHTNSSWYYPGDIVAQLGSRDPGTVLEINLDNSIHESYTSLATRFLPGGTHSMSNYQESAIRLATNSTLLKNPNPHSATTPFIAPLTGDEGGNSNDVFINRSASGGSGNDLFIFDQAGTYIASGDAGQDLYSINAYGIYLTIDGRQQAALGGGRDTLLFNLPGSRQAFYEDIDLDGIPVPTATFSVNETHNGQQFTSSVTIKHWDEWQLTDIFQVQRPSTGRWSLQPWTDLDPGPNLRVSLANPATANDANDPGATEDIPSGTHLRISLSAEPRDNSQISLGDLLRLLASEDESQQLSVEITTERTNQPGRNPGGSDTRFYRVRGNRFNIEATLSQGAGLSAADVIAGWLRTLTTPTQVGYEARTGSFVLDSGSTSVSLPNLTPTTTDDIISLRLEVAAAAPRVSKVAYIVLDPNEQLADLSTAELRIRALPAIASLENQDTTAFAAPLSLSRTLQLVEGERLAFLEVMGESIQTASELRPLQLTQLSEGRLELRTSLGMVLHLVAAGFDDQGLSAFIARDQAVAPILNFTGLRATDVITGEVVLAREASFNTDGGLYRIETLDGQVRDPISGQLIAPGQSGYSAAALQLSVGSLSGLRIQDRRSTSASFSLSGDSLTLLAPYATVNDGSAVRTYFAFAAASPDGLNHFRILGDNVFGFEDQWGGGDGDFDDLVVGFRNLSLT